MNIIPTSTLNKDKSTYSIESNLLTDIPEGIEPIVSVQETYEGVKGIWTCLYRASKIEPPEWDYNRYLIAEHNGEKFYLEYVFSNGSPVIEEQVQV